MEKWIPFCVVDRNINWYNHYGKQYGSSSKKFLIELAYHPAILLLFLSEEKEITNLEQYMHPYGGSAVKNLLAKAGHLGSISGSGKSPGEENGNPLHYSCLGNPMVGYSPWGHKESDTI